MSTFLLKQKVHVFHVLFCWADSTSRHLSQQGLDTRPIVWRCLFNEQCPVNMSVSRLMFLLLKDKKIPGTVFGNWYTTFSLSCCTKWAPVICECFIFPILNGRSTEIGTGILGSGPIKAVLAAWPANLSAASFSSIPMWPRTQMTVT